MNLAMKLKELNNDEFAFKDIKKYLIERFLYNNDIDCINILLNIYNIEDSIDYIFPRYVSLERLRRDIIKIYKGKEGIDLIAKNLSQYIHDDINRFELYLYLEGYRSGFNSKKLTDKLEVLALKYFTIEELYIRKKLFNYEINNKEVIFFKKQIFKELRRDKFIRRHLRETIKGIEKHLLRDKIDNLNSHLDLQLVINDEDSNIKFREMNSYLDSKELYTLNKKIIKFLYVDGFRIFRNAYWDGINDKVIKRYK